jgi:hypothetical protein
LTAASAAQPAIRCWFDGWEFGFSWGPVTLASGMGDRLIVELNDPAALADLLQRSDEADAGWVDG